MNISEILKAKGIADDIVQAVLDDMKANKIYTSNEENIDVRYSKLKADHEAAVKERDEGKTLIEDLQKKNKDNETLQQQIADYKAQVEKIQVELAENKLNSAISTGLLAAGVQSDDVDYLVFKLREKGELKLDENGKIQGWDDKLAGLKVQCPKQFPSASEGGDGYQVYNPAKLDGGDGKDKVPTREDFQAMTYEQRVALKQKNEELYKKLRQ